MAYMDKDYCKAHEDEFKQEIKKLRSDSYYCEVAYKDFKGRVSILQNLCISIGKLGIEVDGYDYEDAYKGWAIIPRATKKQIAELHKRYRDNLSIEWCECDYDSYEKCLEYVNNRREERVTKYEELIKKGNSQINVKRY